LPGIHKFYQVKVINKIIAILIFVLFFISCQKNEVSKNEQSMSAEKSEVAQNLQHVKVEIKGMTCEIGCARLIQSKLYKADGITFAKISFEDSSGIISYDQNRITPEQVKNVIENTAGGGIYQVAAIEEIKAAENLGIEQ
jgi:mercuric ion binding protein